MPALKTKQTLKPLTPDQYASLAELSERFDSTLPKSFGSIQSIIAHEWSIYIMLLRLEGRATNATRSRRTALKRLARDIGHKITIEDAKQALGELDPVLMDLLTADIDEMQKPQQRGKRGGYKRRPKRPRFQLSL